MRDDHLRDEREAGSAGIAAAVREHQGVTVVEFAGELDVFVEGELRATLAELADIGAPVCIDLHAVPFVDSTGLAVLLWARRRLRDRGATLALARVQPPVAEALGQAGLGARLRRYPSPEEAAAALAAEGA